MGIKLTWHGHSNFQIQGEGVNIIIDPFFTGNPKAVSSWQDAPKTDAVLVTHMHGDHSGDAINICKRDSAQLCAVVEAAASLVAQGLPEELVANGIGFNIGGTIQVKGASILMVEAFHSSEAGVPCGFIITMPDGFTVYHAGDTGIFANMAFWSAICPIDVALLPIGGTFTMDAKQAAMAVNLLKAKSVVPMHYGTFPALAPDANEFAHLVQAVLPECEPAVMQVGQTLSF